MTTVSNEIPDLGNMFRPSPPASLPLTESFILRYVTVSSSALSFTTTTASSADPLPVTVTSLLRLGDAVAVTTLRHRRLFTG